MKPLKTTAVALALAVVTSGCGIYKKYELPVDNRPLAAEYSRALNGDSDTASFGTTPWREVFTDPVLVDLIEIALANNTSLANAKLNVDIAQAQLKGARLAYLPSVALTPNGAGASYAGSDMTWSYQIPMAVSWEVDVFGKLLNNKRGAEVSLYQTRDYEQAVRSQIIGAVATCYYTISALKKQLDVNRSTAESWKQSVEVMKNLKLAGRVNEAAVVQSTAQYYSILASITDLETSLVQAGNTMSLLLNTLPQYWSIPTGAVLDAPGSLGQAVAVSQLANRPDVRAAEMVVAKAFYAVNSARAAFYPGLTITSNGGFTNLLGSMIKNPGDWFIQLAGSLTAPLFARGANIARLEASKAQQEQAMNSFEYAILNGAAEVSNAMTVYQKSVEKSALLKEQTANLEKSVEYTTELLTYGTGTYLEVLTAQQNLLSSQTAAINADLTRSKAVINLYQALGGGK